MKQLSDEEIIAVLRNADVPEPSPLFWDHLSQRVKDAVANEPPPSTAWVRGFSIAWAVGVFGAIAVIVLAVGVTTHRGVRGDHRQAVLAPSNAHVNDAVPALEDDASWTVMGDLASQMDFDEAAAAGLIATPGSAERAVGELSQDEQRAAVELLQQEIKNSKRL